MAVVPNPRTWSKGEIVTESLLNQEARDNLGWKYRIPCVQVYRSTSQSSQGTSVGMTWTTATINNDGMFNGSVGTPSSRLTCITAGIYSVILHVEWSNVNDSNAGTRLVRIYKNASGFLGDDNSATNNLEVSSDIENIVNNDGGHWQTSHLAVLMPLTTGDYIEAVMMNSLTSVGSNTHGGGAQRTYFGARWLGVS